MVLSEPAHADRSETGGSLAVELTAVIVAVTGDEPRVLALHGGSALPSGPLQSRHRTLQSGVRSWVEDQTGHPLGYVEQLYTFADRERTREEAVERRISISYLGLTRERGDGAAADAAWYDWYRYFPWEDWRRGPHHGRGDPAAAAGLDTRSAAGSGAGTPRAHRGRLRHPRPRLERGIRIAALRAVLGGRPRVRIEGRRRPAACRYHRRHADDARPSPHPRHRHRAAARQDQIPACGLRADARELHPVPAPARGRGARRPAAA